MRVDQYVTGFAPHDAIGKHTLQVRQALRGAGFESDIWAEVVHPPLGKDARPFHEDRPGGQDKALLYQCSTNSALAAWLGDRAREGEPLIMHYHNITPALYFERWHRPTAAAMGEARDQLSMLAPRTRLAMAVSGFNERELVDLGYKSTAICPLLVDLDEYHRPPHKRALDRLRRRRDRSGAQWLFVGRFVPNKCQHDVIGSFAAYRQLFDPAARLTLVGGATHHRYQWALKRLVHQLGLDGCVELTERLPDAELLAHWAVADVFVCLSEHEGFCLPVIEAMELGVPVVAYAAAAVPETVGDAAVLLKDKDIVNVARAVHEVCGPGARRDELVRAGLARAAGFSLARTRARFLETLAPLVGQG